MIRRLLFPPRGDGRDFDELRLLALAIVLLYLLVTFL